MNYILVVYQTSLSMNVNDRTRLSSIVGTLESTARTIEGSKILAENCVLLPVQNGLQALPDLQRVAKEAGLKCLVEFLSDPPA